MNKQEFLSALQSNLSGLPQSEIEERIAFYSEMIDDRREDGLSEDEAINAIGSVEEIGAQIIADTPIAKIAIERIKPKRTLKAWEIVLIAIGSPIWLSLAIALIAVILSIYIALWSVIISLWAIFISLIACFIGAIVTGNITAAIGNHYAGIALIAAGLFSAGLAIFGYFGCKAATKGILIFTKKIAFWIKNLFIKKEEK